ncbi:hypothetical protein UFOVP257_309 [uncultured Caudovirales phage]|uniref:Uncharacterized protein n=1 Tax=uncultured Caudovirales phage TaxID=2100421 RepID=A0A6J5LKH3_9CAUD|nr:hypothetical protein UFOVP257_309 [uncultured Caudovirales phage]
MTSQVNPNNIDGTYPVAGQDNDSQGFRDNFTNIRNNLTYVKAEIEDIQNKAIFKTNLNNTTLSNDFLGNALVNASMTGWRESYNAIGSVSGPIYVDFANGNFQKIVLNGATTLNFLWPSNTSGQAASIKLWVNFPVADPTRTLTFASPPSLGDPDTIAGYNAGVITFNSAELANNADYLFEIWTVDGGTTLGIKDLIRNRDIDLSGMSITGNLSLDNISASGNVVTTNGIFWSGNGQPFAPSGGSGEFTTVAASSTIIGSGNIVAAATTNNVTGGDTSVGALIVKGSTGVVGNVNVDGTLWINSGNIRSTSGRANIFNITASTISLGNAASFISIGATSSNVFLSGGLTAVGNITTSANLITPYITSAIGSGADITIEPDGSGDIILGASTTSNVVINATTTSTAASTTTGALVVSGGVGIASNINVGGNLVTNGGRINTSTFLATVVTGQELVANVAYNAFIIDTASSTTIANLWVTIPATAVNGTEIVISTLAPLTSCNVRAIGGAVKWVPTTFASSGNVSVKLVYNSTSSAWLRSS